MKNLLVILRKDQIKSHNFDNYLPITRDKLFDVHKILKYIPNKLQNKFNVCDTLYSINSMPQILLNLLFDRKIRSEKKLKIKNLWIYIQKYV